MSLICSHCVHCEKKNGRYRCNSYSMRASCSMLERPIPLGIDITYCAGFEFPPLGSDVVVTIHNPFRVVLKYNLKRKPIGFRPKTINNE